MSTKEEAGRRIRESRIKLGLTLKDVQQRANAISISRLSNWEQGLNMIDVDSAKELSKILNVSPGYLLTIDESPMNKQEQVLLDIYRQTDERGKASILRIAETESSYIYGHDETENNNKNFSGQ
jgi:transcriptional regulator with XRE-family HTH domain